MIYFLFLLILISFSNYKYYGGEFHNEYLNKDNTTLINGIFICIVFLAHFTDYVVLNNPLDRPYNKFRWELGQLQVAMFLFYSGYGIMSSIFHKGQYYINSLPLQRIVKTLLHFNIALTAYLFLFIVRNGFPPLDRLLKSIIAWNGFGNSNWYIFVMLSLWCITYFIFRIFPISNIKTAWLLLLITIAEIYILSEVKQSWWYNTIICFPIGILYRYYIDDINYLLFNNKRYIIIFLLAIFTLVISHKYNRVFIIQQIEVIAFVISILLVTMKIQLKSNMLMFCGTHLFEIYILMRLPMSILAPYFNGHNYRFFVVVSIVTALSAYIFKILLEKIDNRLFVEKCETKHN